MSRPPEAAPHEHRTQWTVAARSEHEEPKCARLLGEHHGGLPLDHDAVDGDIGETLDYSYEKQLKLMANVKNGIAEVATSRKRLQNQQDSLREQVVKLDGQARQVLAMGNEDLSRAALERKRAVQDEIGSVDAQVTDLKRQQEQLTGVRNASSLAWSLLAEKEVVKALYSAAQAQVQMSEATAGVGEQTADPVRRRSARSRRPRTWRPALRRWASSSRRARSGTSRSSAAGG